jgi:hypothetical protein
VGKYILQAKPQMKQGGRMEIDMPREGDTEDEVDNI